jgi:hypothetical protein
MDRHHNAPSSDDPRPLTALQQQWLTHLQAAARQRQSTTEYARAHGLDPDAMHRWRAALKKRGVDVSGVVPSPLVRAQVVSAPAVAPALRIVLPSGVAIELPANAVSLSALVSALS